MFPVRPKIILVNEMLQYQGGEVLVLLLMSAGVK